MTENRVKVGIIGAGKFGTDIGEKPYPNGFLELDGTQELDGFKKYIINNQTKKPNQERFKTNALSQSFPKLWYNRYCYPVFPCVCTA